MIAAFAAFVLFCSLASCGKPVRNSLRDLPSLSETEGESARSESDAEEMRSENEAKMPAETNEASDSKTNEDAEQSGSNEPNGLSVRDGSNGESQKEKIDPIDPNARENAEEKGASDGSEKDETPEPTPELTLDPSEEQGGGTQEQWTNEDPPAKVRERCEVCGAVYESGNDHSPTCTLYLRFEGTDDFLETLTVAFGGMPERISTEKNGGTVVYDFCIYCMTEQDKKSAIDALADLESVYYGTEDDSYVACVRASVGGKIYEIEAAFKVVEDEYNAIVKATVVESNS